MKVPKVSLVLGLAASLVSVPAFAQHDHPEGGNPPDRLGTVHFATSCSPAVEKDFDRSVALLHSFWFSAAIKSFQDEVAHRGGDPSTVTPCPDTDLGRLLCFRDPAGRFGFVGPQGLLRGDGTGDWYSAVQGASPAR